MGCHNIITKNAALLPLWLTTFWRKQVTLASLYHLPGRARMPEPFSGRFRVLLRQCRIGKINPPFMVVCKIKLSRPTSYCEQVGPEIAEIVHVRETTLRFLALAEYVYVGYKQQIPTPPRDVAGSAKNNSRQTVQTRTNRLRELTHNIRQACPLPSD